MIPSVFFPVSLQPHLRRQGLWMKDPELKEPLNDEQAMHLAIQEAYRGLGFVSPNPLVGCVILDETGRFLSKGFHARYGEGHAEVQALQGLDHESLKGARVFVTLEPCAHQGKTPSCAKALAQLPIAQVIFGLVDPNPLVAGQGAEILRNAGIEVREYAGLKNELEEVCEHFLWNFREKKVFVSGKVASSLDGQLALASGESKWITDAVSREVSHVLRAAHDAILVGANTLLMDDPSLNVRHSVLSKKKPKVLILDTQARCLQKAHQMQIAKIHAPEDVCFVISDQAEVTANPWGAQVLRLGQRGKGVDLDQLLTKLWEMGIRSLFVEGGAQVLSSFINEKKLQRLYLFQAPLILGAKSSKAWTEQVRIESMASRISLRNLQTIPLAQDLLITGNLN